MSAESAAAPLEILGARWEVSARASAGGLLVRHSRRLTSAERAYYQEAVASASRSELPRLRRRLHDRLFRSFRRPASVPSPGGAAPRTREEAAGPYNDRAVLAETLRRAAGVDPLWVAELTDLAAGVERLRRMVGPSPLPPLPR